jgi:VWFA-related protein
VTETPRKMNKSARVLIVCYLFAAWGRTSASSPQAPPSGDTPSAARPLTLDIVVTDKSGNPVSGLLQQDFTLLDDKQPKPILSFHATDQSSGTTEPMQAIFIIDEVNSSPRALSNARQQLEKFLRQSDGQLPVPVSMVFFTDKSTEVQSAPTRNAESLIGSLKSADWSMRQFNQSSGFYADLERLQRSLNMLGKLTAYEARQPGRKLVIWLSPGWPLLALPENKAQLTPKDQESIFQAVVWLSAHLREARVTIYDIDPLGAENAASFQAFYYENFLKGVVSADKAENGNRSLQVLAFQTGGRVLNRSNDLADLIATSVADARDYYTLTFAPAVADRRNEYHDLQVKISKPGLTARTRTGYYAQRIEAVK